MSYSQSTLSARAAGPRAAPTLAPCRRLAPWFLGLGLLLLAPVGVFGQEPAVEEPTEAATAMSAGAGADSLPEVATAATADEITAPESTAAEADAAEPPAADAPTDRDTEAAPAEASLEETDRKSSDTATGLEALPGIGGEWTRRIDELVTAIRERRATPADADALYPDLVAALHRASRELQEAVESDAADAEDFYKQAELLYIARLKLLKEATPRLRTRLHSFDSNGLREFRDEMLHLGRGVQYRVATTRLRLASWVDELRDSPLMALRGVIALGFLVAIFRWWRRHGARGLLSWRQRLTALRPRRRRNVRLAKFLWYVDRVRPPIEWMAFVGVFLGLIVSDDVLVVALVWAVGKWILVGWFAVLLIDAAAARGAAGIGRDSSGLRLRSLRLISTWVVLTGLVLELVSLYSGKGTIYAWFRSLATLLLVPVLVLLVQQWRSEIFERLSTSREKPAFIRRRLGTTTGVAGFISAVICGIYLLAQGILRWALRLLSRFVLGKRALTLVFRREVARQSAQQRRLATGEPVSPELAGRLLDRNAPPLSDVARQELQTLLTLARLAKGNVAAVIGSRGAGKTTILHQVRASLGESALYVDCPPGSYDRLVEEIGTTLALSPETAGQTDAVLAALEAAQIEVVLIDNVHVLTKPTINGLDELDRLLDFEARLGPAVSWIISLDAVAWQYINRLRNHLLLAHQIVHLAPWTEAQIGALVEARNQAADIEPDFEQLILPQHLAETHLEAGERTKTGFYRILWDSAAGNPEVAIRLWIQSLVVIESGGIAVRLFPPPSTKRMDGLDPLMLFALRTILQLETATPDEIGECLQLSNEQVREILRSALSLDLIQEDGGRYHIPWSAHQAVKLVLMRQNLLQGVMVTEIR